MSILFIKPLSQKLILVLITILLCNSLLITSNASTNYNPAYNLANKQMVVTDGKWIYYINAADEQKLYSVSADGKVKNKLSDVPVSYIYLEAPWIYYCYYTPMAELPEGVGIYKVRTDGSETVKLSNDNATDIMVDGDWLYYKDYNYPKKDSGRIFRFSKEDGSSRKKLNNVDSWYMVIANGWIYYTGNMKNLYKMKTDGSQNTVISKDFAQFMNVAGDCIYYSNPLKYGEVNKIKTNGTGKTRIKNVWTKFGLIVKDGWIYYLYNYYKLYKVKADYSSKKMLVNKDLSQINIIGGWIYYVEMNPPYKMYKIKTDGTGKTLVD